MASVSASLPLAVCLCLVGCGNSSSAIDARQPAIDGAVADIDAGPSFDEIAAGYGTIETIAGTGAVDKKGVNGWQAAFEGGPATEAELSRPHMSQADLDGNIYIADKDAHAIRRIDESGIITTFAGTNVAGDDGDGPGAATSMRLSSPNGLWVGQAGSIYVLDLGNDKVRRIKDGMMTTLFRIGGASTGRGLWVADDESLAYVAAGSVLKRWTPEEGVRTFATGFASLANLYVRDDGNILLADRLGHRVYRVSPTGQRTVIAGNGQTSGGGDGSLATETGLDEVRGVWPHPVVGLFVATHKGGQVWYVDSVGHIHLFVDGDASDSHSGDGEPFASASVRISEPRAVSVDAAGNLLITEHDGGYLRRVRAVP